MSWTTSSFSYRKRIEAHDEFGALYELTVYASYSAGSVNELDDLVSVSSRSADITFPPTLLAGLVKTLQEVEAGPNPSPAPPDENVVALEELKRLAWMACNEYADCHIGSDADDHPAWKPLVRWLKEHP